MIERKLIQERGRWFVLTVDEDANQHSVWHEERGRQMYVKGLGDSSWAEAISLAVQHGITWGTRDRAVAALVRMGFDVADDGVLS